MSQIKLSDFKGIVSQEYFFVKLLKLIEQECGDVPISVVIDAIKDTKLCIQNIPIIIKNHIPFALEAKAIWEEVMN